MSKKILNVREITETSKVNGHILNYNLEVQDLKKFTIDGVRYKDYFGTYLYNEEKIAILINNEWVDILEDWIETKIEVFKYSIGDPVYVSTEKITSKNKDLCTRRYFSHKNGEEYMVFADGKDAWTFTGKYESWKYAISESDLELLINKGEIK